MKPSELPGTRSLYHLTNRALTKMRELWQYAGEDELPPDSLLQAQIEALRILHIEVPLSAKRQFQLFCSEHFHGLADILDRLDTDQLWAHERCVRHSADHDGQRNTYRVETPVGGEQEVEIAGQPRKRLWVEILFFWGAYLLRSLLVLP